MVRLWSKPRRSPAEPTCSPANDATPSPAMQAHGGGAVDAGNPDFKPEPSSLDSANFISKLTLYWASRLLSTAYKRRLEMNDVQDVPRSMHAVDLGAALERNWTGSFFGTIRIIFLKEFLWIVPPFLVLAVTATTTPFLVQMFLKNLSGTAPPDSLNGWVIVVLIGIIGVIQSFAINTGFLKSTQMATKIRSGVSNMVFRKSVRLTSASRASLSAGDVLNLMSQDTERLFFAGLMAHTIWYAMLMVIAIAIILLLQIGVAGLAAVLFACLLMPFTAKIAEWIGVRKRKMLRFTDERVSLSSEILQGIQTVKMQNWEDFIKEKVFKLRKDEMVQGRRVLYLLAVNAWQVFMVPPMMAATCFAVLAATNPDRLNVATIYAVLAFLNTLMLPLDLIPRATGTFAQALVSVRRIERFMALADVPGGEDTSPASNDAGNSESNEDPTDQGASPSSFVQLAKVVTDDEGNDAPLSTDVSFAKPMPDGKIEPISSEISPAAIIGQGVSLEMTNCTFYWTRRKDESNAEDNQKRRRNKRTLLRRARTARFGGSFMMATSFRTGPVFKPMAEVDEEEDKQDGQNHHHQQDGTKAGEDVVQVEQVDVLRDVNLKIHHGELLVIVGEVGSGKTSFLQGILGEIGLRPGGCVIRSAQVPSSIAYVPQEPWIQNNTLRNNVLFTMTRSADESIYEQVIRAVQMEPDLKTLPKGDKTEIGSRGINLSGGQKARVGLARAVYHALAAREETHSKMIVACDDPFSALDPNVASAVWHEVMEGLLEGMTRVVCLNSNLSLASRADRIVVLDEGRIKAVGTPKEILNDPDFAWLFDAREAASSSAASVVDEGTTKVDAEEELRRQEMEKEIEKEIEKDEDERLEMQLGGVAHTGIAAATPVKAEDRDPESKNKELGNGKNETVAAASNEVRFRGRNIQSTSLELTRRPTLKLAVAPQESTATTPAQTVNNAGKLYKAEERTEGRVSLRTYWNWMRSGSFFSSPAFTWALVISMYALTQGLKVFADLWLGTWSRNPVNKPVGLGVYFGAVSAMVILSLLRALVFTSVCARASVKLHDDLVSNILRAPVNLFFDVTPVGRILNRMSNDMDNLDTRLPEVALQLLNALFQILGAIVMAAYASPFILLILLPLSFIFSNLAKRLSRCQRELKRFDGMSRSPLFSHFSETLSGLTTVRAFDVGREFLKENERLIDRNTQFFFMFWMTARWLAVRVDLLAVACQFSICALALGTKDPSQNTAVVGLAVTYSLMLTTTVQACTRYVVETDNAMIACERIMDLIENVPQERVDGSNEFVITKGDVEFENVSARYRPNLDLCVRNVSFKVKGGQKVGLCGRSGSAKSTLGNILFGMLSIEPGGRLLFDGMDSTKVSLNCLRSQLSVIPQSPVIFSGTIRFAIDPWGQCKSDAELWRILKMVEIDEFVRSFPGGLDGRVDENASSFSVGERQLLCVARALLRKSKVVLLDESTASVDAHSDVIVQRAVQEGFKGATIFVIAHRLHTIIDSDVIAVMESGRLKEFGSPNELLNIQQGMFRKMWDQENANAAAQQQHQQQLK